MKQQMVSFPFDNLKKTWANFIVTPHHHTSISDCVETKRRRLFRANKPHECRWLVPLSLSIDDRSIVYVCVLRKKKKKTRWKKMIKIYIRFPLTDITSKYEQKAKQIHSISVQYPFLLLPEKNFLFNSSIVIGS